MEEETRSAVYLNASAAALYLLAGAAGLAVSLAVKGGVGEVFGWIAAFQACCVLAFWPHLRRKLNYSVSPLVLLFLSSPLYAAGIRLGGTGAVEVVMSLLLLYILFLYVWSLLRCEEMYGRETAAWYIPVSTVLVAGPIVVYYVLAEFLKRPVPWILNISPLAALGDIRRLTVSCASWAIVLIIIMVFSFLSAGLEVRDEG